MKERNEWSPSKVCGLYGQGMHNFILRELEIGYRAAAAEDTEWFTGLGVWVDISYMNYMHERGEL